MSYGTWYFEGAITEKINCYHEEDSTFSHTVTKLGWIQEAVEIDQRPSRSPKQGFTGASAGARG